MQAARIILLKLALICAPAESYASALLSSLRVSVYMSVRKSYQRIIMTFLQAWGRGLGNSRNKILRVFVIRGIAVLDCYSPDVDNVIFVHRDTDTQT